MKNILGREVPDIIKGYGAVKHYEGLVGAQKIQRKKGSLVRKVTPSDNKLFYDLDLLLDKLPLKDGMVLSFHHHLRNGDFILNMVMKKIAERGYKGITVAASSIFPCHSSLVELIENKTVTSIYAAYISGPVAEAISNGKLENPAIMHTHGGRSRIMESGDLKVDIAFIGAPTSDDYGNINGVEGKSACGALGYAHTDAEMAEVTVAITDNLVDYPNTNIEISQTLIDYVVTVDAIGDPNGIVSGTTQITKNPIGLKIASMTTELIKNSGYFKDGISFQTGAGGVSLAVAAEMKKQMKEDNIKGSFASGGITSYIVNMYKEGLFKALFDVQCFDLEAIKSIEENKGHIRMSASMYGNPYNKGAVVNKLDVVILGATEIDTDFNVNVTTASNGMIMGGSGGHADTAAGAKLSIIVTQLANSRISAIKDRVTTLTTPGETIDVVVTERGIAINSNRKELIERLKETNLPIMSIEELKTIAESMTGKPREVKFTDEIVALIEYRDGTVIDVIKKTK